MLPPGTVLDLGDHTVEVLGCPEQTGDRYRLRIVADPGGGPGVGSGAHVHPHLTETFTCLSGVMLARHGDRTEALPVGQRLEVPPGQVHGFVNAGDAELVVEAEVVFDPAGPRRSADLMDFAASYAGLVRDGRVRARTGQPSLLQMAVLYDRYSEAVAETGPAGLILRALAPVGRRRGYRADFPEYTDPGP